MSENTGLELSSKLDMSRIQFLFLLVDRFTGFAISLVQIIMTAFCRLISTPVTKQNGGALWPSCRVSDSGARDRGFDTYHHRVVC